MGNAATGVSQSPADITFACSNCHSALVVDAAAAGMTLECQKCGKPTIVPAVPFHQSDAAKDIARINDLKRQLKENESQRTEISSYINQLSIQLHRWQLRLGTLNERKTQIELDLNGKRTTPAPPGAAKDASGNG